MVFREVVGEFGRDAVRVVEVAWEIGTDMSGGGGGMGTGGVVSCKTSPSAITLVGFLG